MSRKIFAANWKMNKTPQQAEGFAQDLLSQITTDFFNAKEIFIFPQNFSLPIVSQKFKNSSVQFGPQQIHTEVKGAFTGENSLDLAQALGSQICLIGHSERRQFFNETNQDIHKKIILCQKNQVLPIVCFGETLQERQHQKIFDVCFEQLEQSLKGTDLNQRIVLAYEPVWAIGTGQVATVDQVRDVHAAVFKKMSALGLKNFQILYGGSVKPDNAPELLQVPHVDGFLIGGASLEVASFLSIASCV